MEEVKEVEVNKESNSTPKMSYEQLQNVAHQLSEQSRTLYNKLQDANMTNMFRRLELLFKVVENSSKFQSDFVTTCTNEIQELMTIEDAPEEVESK